MYRALLLLFAAACGAAEPRAGGVRIDTLAGFRIGQLYPEVVAQAREHGYTISCKEEFQTDACQARPTSSAQPPVHLTFQNGLLVLITKNLQAEWRGVAFDSLRRRHEAFGEPAEVKRIGGSYAAIWMSHNRTVRRGILCSDTLSAASCEIGVERVRAPAR